MVTKSDDAIRYSAWTPEFHFPTKRMRGGIKSAKKIPNEGVGGAPGKGE